jgi:glycosyltransferase involved in cell wall biosynthesis
MADNSIKPDVSIIMAVYNTEKYLFQCLRSILSQTFKNFELIAVDDGSSDDSFTILKEFEKQDSRIRIYQNKERQGVSGSLNRAIKHCISSLVIRMDSDDIMLSNRIERQYKYIRGNPDCVLLGGQVKFIDDKNKVSGQSDFPISDYKIKKNLFYFQGIADSTILINRKLIPRSAFYFNSNLTVAEGLDLYFRLFNYGKFANMQDTLLLLRNRPGSLSKKIRRNFKVIAGVRVKAIKEYGIRAPLFTRLVTFLQGVIVMFLPYFLLIKLFDAIRKIFTKQVTK